MTHNNLKSTLQYGEKKSKVTSKITLISTKNTRTTVKYCKKTENYHNKNKKIQYFIEKYINCIKTTP